MEISGYFLPSSSQTCYCSSSEYPHSDPLGGFSSTSPRLLNSSTSSLLPLAPTSTFFGCFGCWRPLKLMMACAIGNRSAIFLRYFCPLQRLCIFSFAFIFLSLVGIG